MAKTGEKRAAMETGNCGNPGDGGWKRRCREVFSHKSDAVGLDVFPGGCGIKETRKAPETSPSVAAGKGDYFIGFPALEFAKNRLMWGQTGAWKVYKISEVPGLPPGEGDYLINFLENRPMWGQQRA